MPRVGQDDDQRPYRTAATRLRVLYQTQTTEVHLRHLAWCALLHPHRRGASSLPTPPTDEPPDRRVRDPAAPARKQLVDAGHLQPVGGEPLVDLVRPGDKDILGRRLHLPRGAQVQPHQAGQLIFTRNRAVSCQARLHPRPDVSTDCLPRQSCTASYLPLTLTGLPAAYHFCYLHSRHLPVRHRRSLHQGCSYGRQSGVRGGPPSLIKWSIGPDYFSIYRYLALDH